MTDDDEKCILLAIKSAVDGLPQATDEKPLPADGINLVIDAGPLATESNAQTMRSKYGTLFDELQHRLGYRRGYLVDVSKDGVFLLFGVN